MRHPCTLFCWGCLLPQNLTWHCSRWPPPVTRNLVCSYYILRAGRVDSLNYTSLSEFPKWYSGKEPTCQCRRCELDPWFGKILCRRKYQPTPVFLPGKFHEERSLAGYSSWGLKELDMTEWLNWTEQHYYGFLLWYVKWKSTKSPLFYKVKLSKLLTTTQNEKVPGLMESEPDWIYPDEWIMVLSQLWARVFGLKIPQSVFSHACSVISNSLGLHCSRPLSSLHGIFQARILQWVAIS